MASVPSSPRISVRAYALALRVHVLVPLLVTLLAAQDALAFLPAPPPPAAAAAAAAAASHFNLLDDAASALDGRASGGDRRRGSQQPIAAAASARRIGSRADFCRPLFASSSTTADDDPASDASAEAVDDKAAITVTGVTLKLAIDSSPACWGIADQSTSSSATTQKASERFTSPQSLDMVHRLRSVSDCVLVGRGTVAADDCTLTVRRGYESKGGTGRGEQPTRVVLDSNLGLLRDHVDRRCEDRYRLLEDGFPVIIYHLGGTTTADDDDIGGDDMEAFLRDRPAITLVDASKLGPTALEFTDDESAISPQLVVRDLHKRGLHHVMVEGGGATALSFLRAGVVDRAIIVKASVQFEEPLDSHISADVMEKEGGLTLVGTSDDGDDGDGDGDNLFGGDSLQYWVRGDGDGRWPSSNDVLTDWP